jgi:flagellar M-ring protein FliF
MSSIRKSSDQFRSAFSELPLPSRVLAVALAAAAVIGLGLLIRGRQSVETALLFGGRTLADQEIEAIEKSLARTGLNDWQIEDRQIKVPAQQRSEFLSALESNAALPPSLRSKVQEAIDKASLFEPTSQREARQSHAKEQDLGNKLSAFADIKWASVEHDLGERKGLSAARTQSASVVVCPVGESPLSPSRVQMIREYIRGSYAGMRAEEVVVIDTKADVATCPVDDPVARRRCEEEARLKQEVHDILRGYGSIRVAAYVELRGESAAEPDPAMPAIIRQSKTTRISAPAEKNKTLIGEIIEAVTHVSSNRATRLPQPNSASPSAATVSVNKVSVAASAIEQARLSIGIPESYYEKVWQQLYLRSHPEDSLTNVPPLQPADLQRLQQHAKENITAAVTPALLARARSRSSIDPSAIAVDVWSFPDLSKHVVVAADSAAGGAAAVIPSSRTLLLLMLACVVIWALLSSLLTARNRQGTSEPDTTHLARSNDVRDELTTLVHQHPDLAAKAIRDWIAEAA